LPGFITSRIPPSADNGISVMVVGGSDEDIATYAGRRFGDCDALDSAVDGAMVANLVTGVVESSSGMSVGRLPISHYRSIDMWL
jgi:hypothetical protein